MNTRRTVFLIAGLTAALAATTVLSAPRMARADAMLPPTSAELGLSANHAKQWDALRSQSVSLREIGRDELRGGAIELRGLLDQPSADLRAFSDASQRKVDTHMAEARALRDRQLDLYESLSPEEQARVRKGLAERLDRLSQLRERIAGFINVRQ